uniref:Uncharacterized protein n=1 Tax=Ixodes scapularis TaxID=6945 RepID=A0A4D5RYX8_IXOSC
MGAGSGGNILGAIFWLLLLVFLSLLVAGICAFIYIIASKFTPCMRTLDPLAEFLMRGVNFPHTCSENRVHGSSLSLRTLAVSSSRT